MNFSRFRVKLWSKIIRKSVLTFLVLKLGSNQITEILKKVKRNFLYLYYLLVEYRNPNSCHRDLTIRMGRKTN